MKVSPAKFQKDVHQALKTWHSTDVDSSSLDYLQLFRETRLERAGNARQATNEILLKALEALMAEHKREASLLRKRFLDGQLMHTIANSFNVGESTAYKLQNEAVKRLAQILYRQETQARKAHGARLKKRLEPPTYSQLIGVEDRLDDLIHLLASSEPPWLVSIEGLGGLGKTSLADAFSRRFIQEGWCDDFGWVSARSQIFNPGGGIKPAHTPALTTEDLVDKLVAQLLPDVAQSTAAPVQEPVAALEAKLNQDFHLIVIDNLETLTDIETLLPLLRELANPAKFLLTSRESLHHEADIYHFKLPELDEANALRLLRLEARLRNLPHLAKAEDASLKRIYDLVGGNPLALRLVVGQTHVHSLDMILADLETARGQKVEMLYTFIYRRAWETLDELTRRVFLATPLVSHKGMNSTALAELTALDAAAVRDALEHLVALNLVDSKGDLTERRYSIHNLTRTFLQEQVAKWT